MLLRIARVTALLVVGPLAAACSADGADATDVGAPDARAPLDAWQVVSLPAPVLSAWGPERDTIFFAGGGAAGGFLYRLFGDTIASEPLSPGGTLWWVFGFDRETIRAVGEAGRIVVRTADGWRDEPTGLSDRAQLWGGHAVDATTHYAVGGSVRLGGEKGLVLLKRGEAPWVRLEDPAFPAETNLYKIWGPGPDELYVVGEAGVALRFDGRRWSRITTPDPDLLFTVHGRAGGPILAVGGITRARVLRLEGDAFVDDGAPSGPPLNGVFVRADGTALVSGANGSLWVRSVDGSYTALRDAAFQPYTLHAVFATDEVWTVGGDLATGGAGVIGTTRPGPLSFSPGDASGHADAGLGRRPDAAPAPIPDAESAALSDRPTPADAASPTDAATTLDARPLTLDAGTPAGDAGRPDAHSPSNDATRPGDAARPMDAAASPPDAALPSNDAAPVPGPGDPCTPPRYLCAEGTHCLQILGPEGFSDPLCLQPCAVPADCDPAFGPLPCCATPGPQLIRTYCIPASAPAESCP